MNKTYLNQELKKEIELQYRHTDVFLEAVAAAGKAKEYLQNVTIPAIERDQEYQKNKVNALLELAMKESDERCKTNPS